MFCKEKKRRKKCSVAIYLKRNSFNVEICPKQPCDPPQIYENVNNERHFRQNIQNEVPLYPARSCIIQMEKHIISKYHILGGKHYFQC